MFPFPWPSKHQSIPADHLALSASLESASVQWTHDSRALCRDYQGQESCETWLFPNCEKNQWWCRMVPALDDAAIAHERENLQWYDSCLGSRSWAGSWCWTHWGNWQSNSPYFVLRSLQPMAPNNPKLSIRVGPSFLQSNLEKQKRPKEPLIEAALSSQLTPSQP